MRVLHRAVERENPCAYLAGERSQLDVALVDRVTPDELDRLLERGWRHFGPFFFQPVCNACRECVPIRVVAAEFVPSRSQKRVVRGGARFRRVVGPPIADDERLSLYERWHANREDERGWSSAALTMERYQTEFCFPHPFAREAAFYDEHGALAGVGLFDEAPRSLNAVFFFYDPVYAASSLGTLNILGLIGDARRDVKPYVYLGFRVKGCPSLRYKANFSPHELLAAGGWMRAVETGEPATTPAKPP